ncbi:MAG TPA: hypothetical protein QF683_02720 [SAR324 cluster bacterium]|jgi:hypothetical protein|nr:hypothetical protein [SAR324 cluster bacterium]|tara:strand:+ start:314 stop:988 length:675 start_codon:yes stop_codon:yes gene_type:complete
MLKTKHLKSLLILWILIMQGCIFTETLMGKKYYPINPGLDRRWHKGQLMKYKRKKEIAERKRGIGTKKNPLQLRFRYLTGEITSGESKLKNQSIALHWKKWGLGQTQSNYESKGLYGIQYDASTKTNDFLYTFGQDWTLTLGMSFTNSGQARIRFLDHLYLSQKVSGHGFLGGLGVQWGILELVIRKTTSEYTYSEFVKEGSINLGNDLKIKSESLSLGLGLSF